jgi:hypothetical protein
LGRDPDRATGRGGIFGTEFDVSLTVISPVVVEVDVEGIPVDVEQEAEMTFEEQEFDC